MSVVKGFLAVQWVISSRVGASWKSVAVAQFRFQSRPEVLGLGSAIFIGNAPVWHIFIIKAIKRLVNYPISGTVPNGFF